MLIVLPFSLWVFLSLFLLVIMMVFLPCNSLNNLNLEGHKHPYIYIATAILQFLKHSKNFRHVANQ